MGERTASPSGSAEAAAAEMGRARSSEVREPYPSAHRGGQHQADGDDARRQAARNQQPEDEDAEGNGDAAEQRGGGTFELGHVEPAFQALSRAVIGSSEPARTWRRPALTRLAS